MAGPVIEPQSISLAFDDTPIGAAKPSTIGGSSPVTTDGELREWYFKEKGLFLDGAGYSIAKDGEVRIVSGISKGTEWECVSVGLDTCRIEAPETSPVVAWTSGGDPNTPVTLVPVGSVEAKYQMFRIKPSTQNA